MKDDCRPTREQLERFLDGELDPRSTARVAAHLAGCPDCRHELEALRAINHLVRHDEPPPLAEDYWDWHRREVWRRLRSDRRARPEPVTGRRFPWLRLATVAAGVAVVMIATVGGWRVLTGGAGRTRPAYAAEEQAAAGAERREASAAERAGEPAVKATVPGARSGEQDGVAVELEVASGGSVPPVRPEGYLAPSGPTPAADADAKAEAAAGTVVPEPSAAGEPVVSSEAALARYRAFADSVGQKAARLRRPVDAVPPDLAGRVAVLGSLPAAPGPDTVPVGIRALVEPDGTVSEVELLRGSGDPAVDSLVRQAVARGRFEPGRKAGIPVRSWVSFERRLLPAPAPDSGR
jgi:TonB family protein